MTISTTISRVSYNGNGVTDEFALSYLFLSNSDLVVILTNASGTDSTLVLNTDYTVTGAGDGGGGLVTLMTPPAADERLTIFRSLALTQETDYITGDPFPAETHERALDRLTMITQQLQDQLDRAPVLSPTSEIDPGEFLEDIIEQATQTTTEAAEAAEAAQLAAESARDDAQTAETGSEAARDKAEAWADEDEDVPVETGPDRFSAKHWAAKAETIVGSPATSVSYDNSTSGLTATDVQDAIDEVLAGGQDAIDEVLAGGQGSYLSIPIGVPFPVWDHLSGVSAPSNAGTAKFIRLTAGQTGASEYNEGLLTNESVSGSAPLVEATAEIDVGPMATEVVHLLNTEGAMLRPGTTAGVLQFDQMQRIIGRAQAGRSDQTFTGAFTRLSNQPSNAGSGGSQEARLDFDSANSPDARTSATTAGETRSKNVSATYYMRIQ